jgi:hypothetical protein
MPHSCICIWLDARVIMYILFVYKRHKQTFMVIVVRTGEKG